MNEAVSESIMTNIGLYHRKGSVYVCILSIAMLITMIGLSSLWALRVERRIADNRRNRQRHCEKAGGQGPG